MLAELLRWIVRYVLRFISNRRGIDRLWHACWNEYLLDVRNSVDRSLLIFPRFPLAQGNTTRRQRKKLKAADAEDEDDYYGTEDDDEDSEDEHVEDDEDKHADSGAGEDEDEGKDREEVGYRTDPGCRPLYNTSRLKFSRGGDSGTCLDNLSPVESGATSPENQSSDEDYSPVALPPRPTKKRGVGSGSVGSWRIRNNKEPFPTLTFAIVKLLGPSAPILTIFGCKVPYHQACVPIVVECKGSPGRHHRFTSIAELSRLIYQAHINLHDKIPVAFRCHPNQKSIIGIATCGIWWSFTVVTIGMVEREEGVVWSKLFQYGDSAHDGIIRALFKAAAQLSDDPASFGDGKIQVLLNRWKRSKMDETDLLAN
ncbi:hypothetical protein RhiJN_16344 [Ceratobasidium sp. AG-Ba]|nr:hypothetical protein RhiJN_16344 [Ceratobasidium sp. AG-Ba]